MKRTLGMFLVTLLLCAELPSQSQQTIVTNANPIVPTLVKFSGSLTDINSKPLSGTVGVTFLLYKDEQGGAPLWMETQNVTPDKSGHYTAVLGSTTNQGLPTDLFASGEARWLGVQAEGQAEQPRVLLLSVPYALKAGDAETVGGLPASAFVLAAPAGGAMANTTASALAAPNPATVPPPASSDVTTTGGNANTIPLFTTGTNIQNSILTQTGTAAVNVGGKLNLPATGTATTTAGFDSRPEAMVASAYDSSTKAAVAQTFQLQAEPAGNDTASPSGTLNLLYGSGTTAPSETGLRISNKGLITFATGQTFPGTGSGTVKSVASGAGLTGGPITASGTLSIANAGVSNAMLAHPSVTITAGTALTGGGAVALGGATTLNVDTTKIPQLNAANTFTGNQTVKGNLSDTGNFSATGSISGHTGAFTANNTTQVVNVTQSGTGSGIVVATSGNTNKPAILANVSSNATSGLGIAAEVAGPTGIGVVGIASSTLSGASALGVEGASTSPNGAGVFGFSQDSTGAGMGVYASSGSPGGVGARGVWSSVSTVGAGISQTGMWGDSSAGVGVVGTSDSSVGVAGASNGANAVGVFGHAVSPSGSPFGVYGVGDNTASVGVFGQNGAKSGTGSSFIGLLGSGVWGDSGTVDNIGVTGTTDDAIAGYFVNNSPTGVETVLVEAQNGGSSPFVATNNATGSTCYFDANGNLNCTGSKNAVVPIDGGKRIAAMSAIESPKNWFEDFGSAELVNGTAVITLDPEFIQTVNTEMAYTVFPVPNGDCKGLFVTHKTATSFEVRELGGGTSNVSFDYRITALRRKYENVRFADHTHDLDSLKKMRERARAAREAGEKGSVSHTPPKNMSLLYPAVQKTAAK